MLALAPLAQWLGNLIVTLAGSFGVFFTKRAALAAAGIAAAIGLTTALWLALEALVATVAVATPDYFTVAVSWFVPSNAEQCVAAVIAGHVLRKAYEIKMLTVQMRLL